MAKRTTGFFQREAVWLVLLTVVLPLVGILAAVVIPKLFR